MALLAGIILINAYCINPEYPILGIKGQVAEGVGKVLSNFELGAVEGYEARWKMCIWASPGIR
jgi:hypothetical protein